MNEKKELTALTERCQKVVTKLSKAQGVATQDLNTLYGDIEKYLKRTNHSDVDVFKEYVAKIVNLLERKYSMITDDTKCSNVENDKHTKYLQMIKKYQKI